jgi:hypothetical protein
MNIDIRIERLILDGLPVSRGHEPLIQAAIEAELARLLSAGVISPKLLDGGAVPSVRAGSLQLTSGGTPAQLGQQIAQAVYRGIGYT